MLLEFLIIVSLNYIGVVLSQAFHLPIPGTILGLVFLFLLLFFRVIKVEQIEKTANFFLLNMSLFFLPPAINLLAVQDKVEGQILKIILLMVVTTFLTMGITGKIVQVLIERKEAKHERNIDQ